MGNERARTHLGAGLGSALGLRLGSDGPSTLSDGACICSCVVGCSGLSLLPCSFYLCLGETLTLELGKDFFKRCLLFGHFITSLSYLYRGVNRNF